MTSCASSSWLSGTSTFWGAFSVAWGWWSTAVSSCESMPALESIAWISSASATSPATVSCTMLVIAEARLVDRQVGSCGLRRDRLARGRVAGEHERPSGPRLADELRRLDRAPVPECDRLPALEQPALRAERHAQLIGEVGVEAA